MGLSNCWLCQGAGAETKLSVDREKFGGIKGNTRVVYVHLGCYLLYGKSLD